MLTQLSIISSEMYVHMYTQRYNLFTNEHAQYKITQKPDDNEAVLVGKTKPKQAFRLT